MLKKILERKYFDRNYLYFYDFLKSVECNDVKAINNNKICSDFALDTIEHKFLLCGYIDGNILIYNVESILDNVSATVFCLDNTSNSKKNSQPIRCIQWYPVDTGIFFSCGMDKKVKMWDTNNGKCVEEISLTNNTFRIALSQCAKFTNLVAAACDKNRTIIIDMLSGSSTHVLTKNSSEIVTTVQWSMREEHIVATGDQGGHVSIWDIRASKRALFYLDQYQDSNGSSANDPNCKAHDGVIRGLEFSPDGLSLATLGNDGKVKIWDIFTHKYKLSDLNFGKLFETDNSARHVRFCWTGHSKFKKIWIPSHLDLLRLTIDDGMVHNFHSMHFDQITSCICNPGYNQFFTSSLDSNILNWNYVL